ncbi:MAG: DUF72 domain-containing protein [Planctomycetaceae bacterium]
MRARNASLVIADVDEESEPNLMLTADWVYLRLREMEYAKDDVQKWIARLNDSGLQEAFVFFKHEDAGTGPKLAQQFIDLAG